MEMEKESETGDIEMEKDIGDIGDMEKEIDDMLNETDTGMISVMFLKMLL